ncbi:MAG: SlyX family protein [Gammaproteobacteria bacterium]
MTELDIDKEIRTNELEARLAHQDNSIEKMSDEIYWQHKKISQLEEKVRWLIERLELVTSPESSHDQSDEVPPHY